MQPFHYVKCATIYQLKVDVDSNGKVFRGFEYLCLESHCVKLSKTPQMLKHCSGLSGR